MITTITIHEGWNFRVCFWLSSQFLSQMGIIHSFRKQGRPLLGFSAPFG
jgi:hypothetical protein